MNGIGSPRNITGNWGNPESGDGFRREPIFRRHSVPPQNESRLSLFCAQVHPQSSGNITATTTEANDASFIDSGDSELRRQLTQNPATSNVNATQRRLSQTVPHRFTKSTIESTQYNNQQSRRKNKERRTKSAVAKLFPAEQKRDRKIKIKILRDSSCADL